MAYPLVHVDTSRIVEGALDDVRTHIDELVAFIDANVPKAITYAIFLDEPGELMSVFQIQPDAAAMEYHMEVGGPAFRKFVGLIELQSIDLYGEPSPKLISMLHAKAEMLGNARVSVHSLRAGFARFGAP